MLHHHQAMSRCTMVCLLLVSATRTTRAQSPTAQCTTTHASTIFELDGSLPEIGFNFSDDVPVAGSSFLLAPLLFNYNQRQSILLRWQPGHGMYRIFADHSHPFGDVALCVASVVPSTTLDNTTTSEGPGMCIFEACNDDAGEAFGSFLEFKSRPNVTYAILVYDVDGAPSTGAVVSVERVQTTTQSTTVSTSPSTSMSTTLSTSMSTTMSTSPSTSQSTSPTTTPTTTPACPFDNCERCNKKRTKCRQCTAPFRLTRNRRCGIDCDISNCKFCQADGSACATCARGFIKVNGGRVCQANVDAQVQGFGEVSQFNLRSEDQDVTSAASCFSETPKSDHLLEWTADSTGVVVFHTQGSRTPTQIALYRDRSGAVRSKDELGCTKCGRCGLRFNVQAGITYRVSVSAPSLGPGVVNVNNGEEAPPCVLTEMECQQFCAEFGSNIELFTFDTFGCPVCRCS